MTTISGLNDSNAQEYPYVRQSQINFLNFFAQDESHCGLLTRGPGVSSALRWGTQLFVLLDDRSYREKSGSKNRYAHWGQEQEEWVLSLLRQNTGPTWLMNGSQVFPNVPWKESTSGDHPVQFREFMKELRTISSKVVFASGDVHYSEISKIEKAMLGYETYEVTSSSIHSKNIPGSPDIIPNSRRIAGTGHRNYVLVKSEADGYGCNFSAISYNQKNDVRFKMKFNV